MPQETSDSGRLRDVAQAAEANGFDALWVYDHFFHYPTPDNDVVLEAWTFLALLAGWTRTARLGTVLCSGYRPPALTAKMAATLDVLSGGRLELGYGIGWHEREHRGYGYAFPPAAARIAMMDEALTIITRLWSGAPVSFSGRHYSVTDAVCAPAPTQRPRPPITIGGGGERLLFGAVARHADVWNYFPVALLEYERKRTVLVEHCQRLGRDPATLAQSLLVPLVTAAWEKEVRDQLEHLRGRGAVWAGDQCVQGTPDIVVPRLRDYVRRGVSSFIFALPHATDLKQIEFVAREIVAELKSECA
jgi:F420-dependent oxidoreductase-like protein